MAYIPFLSLVLYRINFFLSLEPFIHFFLRNDQWMWTMNGWEPWTDGDDGWMFIWRMQKERICDKNDIFTVSETGD